MKKPAAKSIVLKGVRQNNLKNFDLELPQGKLIVVTGLSGSGKSSLAFETLFAEGQRRYIETFSPYARQFLDRMDRPKVDRITGIPPAIALQQTNNVRTTRSTVGTMTELTDYLKAIWPQLSQLHCRNCGKPVVRETPQHVWLDWESRSGEVLITFRLATSENLTLEDSIQLIRKAGYSRVVDQNKVVPLEEAAPGKFLEVVQDRISISSTNKKRFIESCEQAFHFGKHCIGVWSFGAGEVKLARRYSNKMHCAECDIEYKDPSPSLFSFNHPVGACPACRGFGRVIGIDYSLAVPDKTKTLSQGAVKPWQTGTGMESQTDLLRFCTKRKVPADVPFNKLSAAHQKWVMEGDEGYGTSPEKEWPKAWYGVKGYFRWLESKAYKMHVRVLLSRYRSYTECETCKGARFQPETLLYKLTTQKGNIYTISSFLQLSVEAALHAVREMKRPGGKNHPVTLALNEIQARLEFLSEVGLGYLTLDRPTRTLSGGETERVNLTTCLGSRLVNTLFVLDEPTVGLHPRDTERLIRILHRLRDTGNTVVVVEHEPSVMRACDQIVDIGPGHGEEGGRVTYQGPCSLLLKSPYSLTGKYLSGKLKIDRNQRRSPDEAPRLTLENAALHNLRNITVEIPLHRFVCVTGVSGSGKTTLVRHLLYPLLARYIDNEGGTEGSTEEEETKREPALAQARLAGHENITKVVLVDQSGITRTPRSTPAVYTGALDPLRELFARKAGADTAMKASAFSFNSAEGQCQKCRGAGFEKIEMQFLSDVFIRCPECHGRRYRPHVLEIKLAGSLKGRQVQWSIADFLEAPVDEAIEFLSTQVPNKHVGETVRALGALQQVGLGYLRLGQPINTLSGGECQRLKLAYYLGQENMGRGGGHTLFIFDEPTTGLHFDDVRILIDVFQKLVERGQSVLVVEHNTELIKCTDWVIDLGPEGGAAGGQIVAAGIPEDIARTKSSFTGHALKGFFSA